MRGILVALLFSTILIFCSLLIRPVLPIDETRYLSVAWEMNWRGDFLVPHLSGELYSHKPPLLFWLINLVWTLVGHETWLARLVAPTIGLACLPLVHGAAKKFWPTCPTTAMLAPIILSSMLFWMIYLPMTMFDTLVSLSTLIALRGLQIASTARAMGWLVCGLGIGLGMLAKGPVVLLFVLSGVICLGLGQMQQASPEARTRFALGWGAGALAAVVLGAITILGWAIPSAIAASHSPQGSGYANDLFLGQSTGRIVKSFAHQRPAYWYLPWIPICALPWIAYPPVWRIVTVCRQDQVVKSLLVWIGIVFCIFSLISGKQLHYLLPLAPLLSLTIARTIAVSKSDRARKIDVTVISAGAALSALFPWVFNHWDRLSSRGFAGLVDPGCSPILLLLGLLTYLIPVQSKRQQVVVIAGSSVLWTCTLLFGTRQYWNASDLQPLATQVEQYHQPIAWYGDYQAQLNYLGKVREIARLENSEKLRTWIGDHDSSIVIFPGPKRRREKLDHQLLLEMQDLKVTEQEQQGWETIVTGQLGELGTIKHELVAVQQLNRGLDIEDYFVVLISN